MPLEGYPDVVATETWVAVQWSDKDPYQVIEPNGTVTERWTLPALAGPAAVALPMPGGC